MFEFAVQSLRLVRLIVSIVTRLLCVPARQCHTRRRHRQTASRPRHPSDTRRWRNYSRLYSTISRRSDPVTESLHLLNNFNCGDATS